MSKEDFGIEAAEYENEILNDEKQGELADKDEMLTREKELKRYRGILEDTGIMDLRVILRSMGGVPANKTKGTLVEEIMAIQTGKLTPKYNPRGRKPMGNRVKVQPNGVMNIVEDDGSVSAINSDDADRKPIFKPSLLPYACHEELAAGEVRGVLEVHVDGYGFLRAKNYECSDGEDIFVSNQAIRHFRLRRGDLIVGKAERTRERGAENLTEVKTVNGCPPRVERRNFDELVPCYPTERFILENKSMNEAYTLRMMDLMFPLGKGQRGLIVAPPKTGKTTLLKKTAQAIENNYPDAHLIVLLIDERPEEVTDIRRSVFGEVAYSTFDEPAEHHIRAAELVMWRAKRLVELGKDVVILLDSITRLTRAYNQVVPSTGKLLSGGIDPAALQAPKKFFGAARNIEGEGSLTILATALVDTGSKMDDVIYEEFKGTGNMEIHLTRDLAERRIFPAIDLYRSGTRKDELLLSNVERECADGVRRFLSRENAVETLIDMIKKTPDNADFVKKFPAWIKLIEK